MQTIKIAEMKTNLFKLYLLTFLLVSDFALFAQPGNDNGGGDLEGDDPPAAPINTKLIWLAIIGIMFAIYTFRKNRKTA